MLVKRLLKTTQRLIPCKLLSRKLRGQQIARVGNAFGQWAYHLHIDLSPTGILESEPQHWPGRDQRELLRHYVNPGEFIRQNRPK